MSNAIQSDESGEFETLSLGNCDILNCGAKALAKFLTQVLNELDLSANEIRDEGVNVVDMVGW